jgi:glycosyltransferase 2 family protein
MIKKIILSKWFRIIFSVVLVFFAFRKVNIIKILGEMGMVPWWFVVAMLVYSALMIFLGGIRWSLLIIDKPKLRDYLIFTKAAYLGSFYALFFPTMVAGDVVKWVPLLKQYPELSKTKLAASVLIDRVVGLAAFVIIGFVSLLVGKYFGYEFPSILLWLFSGLVIGVFVFFLLVFNINFEKIFSRYRILKKLLEVVDILKQGNKRRIFSCFVISLLAEPIWMMPVWFYSLIFNVGISLLQVYIFIPVISLILVLPISIAGFGARENLYLFFLSPLGFVDDKILLVSTFGGLINILNSLLGGILTFF